VVGGCLLQELLRLQSQLLLPLEQHPQLLLHRPGQLRQPRQQLQAACLQLLLQLRHPGQQLLLRLPALLRPQLQWQYRWWRCCCQCGW
jgi:hypothetical protein